MIHPEKPRIDMSVTIAGVTWKNPVTTASGTFGSGMEYKDFFDLSVLGAVTTKGVADRPWAGNPTPRIAETSSGMLNAIGLQNPGIDTFLERDLPFLAAQDTNIIVNVCGKSEAEYVAVAERLSEEDAVSMLEINISCPNVKEGGIAFGQDPRCAAALTEEIRKHTRKPVIMKLSPNVTDITELARAVEAGGADAVSMINTITGMKIDVKTRRFALANRTGGLSGPAIHPVAVRMVWQSAQAVSIPIIGMGGVRTAEDAIELILAGASAVAVGTANFRDPLACKKIIEGMETYMREQGVGSITQLIGAVG